MAVTYNAEVTLSVEGDEPLDMLQLARSLSGFHSSAVPVVCAIGQRVAHGAIVELTATRAQVLAWWENMCRDWEVTCAWVRVVLVGELVYSGCIREWADETTTPITSPQLKVTVPVQDLSAETAAHNYAQLGIDAVVCRRGNHILSIFPGYETSQNKQQYVRDLIALL